MAVSPEPEAEPEVEREPEAKVEAEPLAAVTTAKGATTAVELSRVQQTVARRTAESKATIPDSSFQVDVDMEASAALLAELAIEPAPSDGDLVVRASAIALLEQPRANGGYRDGRLLLNARVNIGLTLAVGEELLVPTIFDADQKSIAEIAAERRTLTARVEDGTITPPELAGATFTVFDLGSHGITSFTAIVNPAQAAVLAVGAAEPRAVVRNGEVVARPVLTLTLTCDHRILYGACAARFLGRVRELLEEPRSLIT
jgi:pyruvate dehydrogenase E2 component (dihydrolipoamide acetyltransferase)